MSRCAILGSGNIGTDLMVKLLRSSGLELTAVVGVDPASRGLAMAREAGVDASHEGVSWILDHAGEWEIVFDATSAHAHVDHAPKLADAGIQVVDLTPAKLGPGVVPVVNIGRHVAAPDVNMISCGGQATIPIVAAVANVCDVGYAEIVATIASLSAGPGTRQNIDEFTATTARGLEEVGGALQGKAVIVLNPAEPPLFMRNTVYCALPEDADHDAIAASIMDMQSRVAAYVPGYRLRTEPVFEPKRVTVFIEVEGAGDYLPPYAGNLDIMTAAAAAVGEHIAGARMTTRGTA
jgi:acetaldehyde dehydrogenase